MVRRDASRRRVPFAAATHREERPFRGDQRREVVGLPSMVAPSGLTPRWPRQNAFERVAESTDMKGKIMDRIRCKVTAFVFVMGLTPLFSATDGRQEDPSEASTSVNEVLDWNLTFVEMLIATNTANSSSQRLGAIVHTAIFDAYNGIEQRYTPLFVRDGAPRRASRRAAVIAAGYTALLGLFPSQKAALDARYEASLATLRLDCQDRSPEQQSSCADRIDRGIDWGIGVARAVLSWRANDGFSVSYPAFNGGMAVGQWRPTPPASGPMSAQGLAFTDMFVLVSNTQFRPGPPRSLTSPRYTEDFNAVKSLGRATGSTRTEDQTALAVFWEGNASVHWNQAANQIARAHHLSLSASNRLLAVLNIAMADTAFTIWSAKRFFGSMPTDVTWRPVTSIPLAESDTNMDTTADPAWLPLVTTPSHPEYPAGHPSQNGAAATILLSHFRSQQVFTLTTAGQPDRDLPQHPASAIGW